ncbi:MAG: carboxy-terminal-processing protease, carboxyl-terminal processing protease [Candidatus Parcubacteria bacterium]|jgi:carboxyl-terminal processing protease
MNTHKETKIIVWTVGILIAIILFWVGFTTGKYSEKVAAIEHPKVSASNTVVTEAQLAPFWKAWAILDQKFVTAGSTTAQDKIWGAIKGLAAAEGDPYTVFFPPAENTAFKEEISGNFEGVGMEIDSKNGVLTVVAPLKGSPAEKAGIHTGDIVSKINGTSTENMTTNAAIKLIRGPSGTTVTLTIIREGLTAPIEKTITRQIINIPTIETEKKDGVFIIRLFSFTAQSPELFRGALREFVLSDTNKLILDLRGNPGGYLDAAWDMASWFLPAGKIVVTEDFGGKQDPVFYRSKGYNIFNDNLRMAILVNGGSASAAEILAGALRENGIGQLVGTKTFGKGSVQELIPITENTSLKVTVARWLTPAGHNLSHDGLVPDFIVADPKLDASATSTTPASVKAANLKVDAQQDKAIEILKK